MEKKKIEEQVTVIMEKIQLDYKTFILRPINVISGRYDKERNIFIGQNKRKYYSINNDIIAINSSKEKYFFMGYYNSKDLKKRFSLSRATNHELNSLLLTDTMQSVWLGTITENEKAKIKIIQLQLNAALGTQNSIDEEYEEDLDYETGIVISEEEMTTLLQLDSIEQIKSSLTDINTRYIEEKKLIYEEMGLELPETEQQLDQSAQTSISERATIEEPIYKKVNIREMYNYITERVIGQDEATKEIITTFLMNKVEVDNIGEQTKIFVTGPTGCGKTLIIDTMIEYLSKFHNLNLPVAKVPTSELVAEGIVGMHISDIINALIRNTKGEFASIEEKIKFAEQNGIVYLDEIEKKGTAKNDDTSGRAVLNSLLQFLSGAEYEIEYSEDEPTKQGINTEDFLEQGIGILLEPTYELHKFNTKYLTIIASGAFSNVRDSIGTTAIGFNSYEKKSTKEIKTTDFIKFGDMPAEFMARFQKIIHLNPLDINMLKRILTEAKNNILRTKQLKFQKLGIDITYDEKFIEAVAQEAHKKGLGARSLHTVIEDSFKDLQFLGLDIERTEPLAIQVTADTVDNPKQYIIEKRGGGVVNYLITTLIHIFYKNKLITNK